MRYPNNTDYLVALIKYNGLKNLKNKIKFYSTCFGFKCTE